MVIFSIKQVLSIVLFSKILVFLLCTHIYPRITWQFGFVSKFELPLFLCHTRTTLRPHHVSNTFENFPLKEKRTTHQGETIEEMTQGTASV